MKLLLLNSYLTVVRYTAVLWLRSMPSNCVGLAFTGFCYKQILYEIILYECYGHGKNVPTLF